MNPKSQDTPPTKLTIVTVDGDGPLKSVTAQFNPKEIGIDKSVPWNKHKNPKGDIPALEFTNAENRSMTLELFFDAAEGRDQPLMMTKIRDLHAMTLIRTDTQVPSEQRPPKVVVTWAFGQKFTGVIESLNIKYTMFSSDGHPLRATCSLKVKEVLEIKDKNAE